MATTHLHGQFGTVREQVDADFPYFGQRIRLNPDATDLAFLDLLEKARAVDVGDGDDDEQESNAAAAIDLVLDAMRCQIHPEDFRLFWQTALANRQQTADLMATSEQLAEVVSGFPTGRSSGSAGGRANIGRRSRGTSRVPAASRALELVRGRPDLQAAQFKAAEGRAAAAG